MSNYLKRFEPDLDVIRFPLNILRNLGRILSADLILLISKSMSKTRWHRCYVLYSIIERVDTPADNKELVHYLPHHLVVHKDKETTKVRVVFDSSSKIKTQSSLNDVLHSDPCLLPFLQDILSRFRIEKIGLVAYTIQAFLQISINKESHDLVRFLWYEDIYKENPELATLRFCRVVFVCRWLIKQFRWYWRCL